MNISVELVVEVITGAIAVCSALANIVPADSTVGRFLHAVALNGPGVRNAVVTVAEEVKVIKEGKPAEVKPPEVK